MNLATLAKDLYPWLRARLWLPLPFTPSGGVTSPFTANGTAYVAPIAKDVTPRRLECGVFPSATNNGSNYWTITLTLRATGGGATTAQGSVNTSALTAGQWDNSLVLSSFTTAAWDATSFAVAYLSLTKTGTPGALYLNPILWVS